MDASPGTPTSAPLHVYVCWHPRCVEGARYAESVFRVLTDDVGVPDETAPGIPVYFRSEPAPDRNTPADIPFAEADHVALVMLIEENMVIDPDWRTYIEQLYGHVVHSDADRCRAEMIAVPLSSAARSVQGGICRSRFVQIDRCDDPSGTDDDVFMRRSRRLIGGVSFEIARLLRMDHDSAPLSVYISHARGEGREIAETIRDRHCVTYPVVLSCDHTNSGPGVGIANAVEREVTVDSAAVIVVETDLYGASERCRREWLWARTPCPVAADVHGQRPVIIVDAIRAGSNRRLFAADGVLAVPWDENEISWILDRLMVDVVRMQYYRLLSEAVRGRHKWPGKPIFLAARPDLLNVLTLCGSGIGTVLVYPDPPLGVADAAAIRTASHGIVVTSPSMCPLAGADSGGSATSTGDTSPVLVAVSFYPSPDARARGYSDLHLDSAMSGIVRVLLAHCFDLVLPGIIDTERANSRLFECARKYTALPLRLPATGDGVRSRLRFYVPWPLYLELSAPCEAVLSAAAEIVKVDPPDGLKINPDYAPPENDDSPYSAYRRARCITGMRERLSTDTRAAIIGGGGISGFRGKLPDVLEEVGLALAAGKPLFLLGAFGGCTGFIVDAIQMPDAYPEPLTYAYQVEVIAREAGFAVTGSSQSQKGHLAADYENLQLAITAVNDDTVYGGLHNGLSVGENEELFHSSDIRRITALIVKGLAIVAPSENRT